MKEILIEDKKLNEKLVKLSKKIHGYENMIRLLSVDVFMHQKEFNEECCKHFPELKNKNYEYQHDNKRIIIRD